MTASRNALFLSCSLTVFASLAAVAQSTDPLYRATGDHQRT